MGENGLMQSIIAHYGYFALFVTALLTSACIPLPSEALFGYAGAFCTVAVGGAHPFNIWLVIIIGTLGSVAGSILTYEVGRTAGRTIVDRYGKWILLSHKDLDRSEVWFKKYGTISVFLGRMVPVIRAVISLPAGLAEMKRGPFIVLSTVGCFIWTAILAFLGKAAGANWRNVSNDFHKAQLPILAICVLVVGAFIWHRLRSMRNQH
jgi:membrane protein DedA with SNARE-associated domain